MRTILLSAALCLSVAATAAAEEIVCSEHCAVVYCVARGAPLTYILRERETPYYRKTYGVADQGEYNQRTTNGQLGGVPGLAMILCGYLYQDTKPVVDVTPDAPKALDALECRVVVKSELIDTTLINDYTFAWKRFEGTDAEFASGKGKWVEADVAKGPKLAAGIAKDGERWGCFVKLVRADGKAAAFEAMDVIEIGKDTPGDSRVNRSYGAFYGQYRHSRGYFKLDISALAGRKIKSAKFRIFCDVQDPPFTVNAYACPNTWSGSEITWVNQPLPFPFAEKPVGSARMDYGPLPTPENPASVADWCHSSSPDYKKEGSFRAPAWREIDITDYTQKVLASGEKSLSLCIALESQSKDDHSRIHIHNDKPTPGYKIDRGDMRPRLAVESQ